MGLFTDGVAEALEERDSARAEVTSLEATIADLEAKIDEYQDRIRELENENSTQASLVTELVEALDSIRDSANSALRNQR